MSTAPRLPLEGLVVVAIEQAVAAPFCSARLADAGARVIKIERPERGFARGYDDVSAVQSSYLVWLSRDKEALVVDLALREGNQSLRVLLAGANVLIQNLSRRAQAPRLWRQALSRETIPASLPARSAAMVRPGRSRSARRWKQAEKVRGSAQVSRTG